MDFDINFFKNFKITSKKEAENLKNFYRLNDHIITENKLNYLTLVLFFLTVLAYEFLEAVVDVTQRESYLETSKDYFSFDPYLTVFAQSVFGTNSLFSYVSAYFYTFGFMLLTGSAFIILSLTILRKKQYRRRDPYVYSCSINYDDNRYFSLLDYAHSSSC